MDIAVGYRVRLSELYLGFRSLRSLYLLRRPAIHLQPPQELPSLAPISSDGAYGAYGAYGVVACAVTVTVTRWCYLQGTC